MRNVCAHPCKQMCSGMYVKTTYVRRDPLTMKRDTTMSAKWTFLRMGTKFGRQQPVNVYPKRLGHGMTLLRNDSERGGYDLPRRITGHRYVAQGICVDRVRTSKFQNLSSFESS